METMESVSDAEFDDFMLLEELLAAIAGGFRGRRMTVVAREVIARCLGELSVSEARFLTEPLRQALASIEAALGNGCFIDGYAR